MPDAPASLTSYNEFTKQILTLSTAVLALTLTFVEDFAEVLSGVERALLVSAWLSYVIAIVMGIWTLSAVSFVFYCLENPGSERCAKLPKARDIYSWTVRVPSLLQVIAFMVATGLIVAVGALEA